MHFINETEKSLKLLEYFEITDFLGVFLAHLKLTEWIFCECIIFCREMLQPHSAKCQESKLTNDAFGVGEKSMSLPERA